MYISIDRMKTFFSHNKSWIITLGLVLVVSLVVMTVSVVSVSRAVEQYEKQYFVEAGKDSVNMLAVPGYAGLLKDKALYGSRVKMVRNDSIGLFLDLEAKRAELVIKGVPVTGFDLEEVAISPLFKRLSPQALYQFLSEPLSVKTSQATIHREPLNVVYAPKDTSSALPAAKPDTTHREPVYFTLMTDKGVELAFYQTDSKGFDDFRAGMKFDAGERFRVMKEFVAALATFSVPAYTPLIRIGMKKRDAKVLYRALPATAGITLSL